MPPLWRLESTRSKRSRALGMRRKMTEGSIVVGWLGRERR
jgi:hypothetical protein